MVGDTKSLNLQEPSRPTIYIPFSQTDVPQSLTWVLSIDGNSNWAEQVRGAVSSVDSGQRVLRLRTLTQMVNSARATPTFVAGLFGTLALIAVVLAGLGVFGLLSYLVVQRRQEIGTRMALGATRANITGMVARQGIRLVTVGVLIGVVLSWFAGRGLQDQLYAIKAGDPLSFAAAVLILLLVGALAVTVPVARAVGIDPMEALRYE